MKSLQFESNKHFLTSFNAKKASYSMNEAYTGSIRVWEMNALCAVEYIEIWYMVYGI